MPCGSEELVSATNSCFCEMIALICLICLKRDVIVWYEYFIVRTWRSRKLKGKAVDRILVT